MKTCIFVNIYMVRPLVALSKRLLNFAVDSACKSRGSNLTPKRRFPKARESEFFSVLELCYSCLFLKAYKELHLIQKAERGEENEKATSSDNVNYNAYKHDGFCG